MSEILDRIKEAKSSRSTSLDLSGSGLNSLPIELVKLSDLRVLDLSRNYLVDLPNMMGNLLELRDLNLSFNKVVYLPEQIDTLWNLRNLNVSHNALQNLPTGFVHLQSLQSLNLSSNRFAEFPAELSLITSLAHLDLSRNAISSLPDSLGKLVNLTSLSLSLNRFTKFPHAVTRLRSLRSLLIEDNTIRIVPDQIDQLSDLRIFSLARNIVDYISPDIGKLKYLRNLNLSSNRLTAIPDEIGNLTALGELNLSSNRLTSIPKATGLLRSLEKSNAGLRFEGNPLPYPYGILSWAGQPGTTFAVLSWLRGELNDQYPANGVEPAGDPPIMPPQTSRPFVEIDNDGTIKFVPVEALDTDGNNLPQLKRLLPSLQDIAQELCAAMPTGGNSEHPALGRRCEAYRDLICKPLSELDFGRVYLEGIRLANARTGDKAEIASGNLPPLPSEAEEALDSLLQFHPSFILATVAGVQAIQAEAEHNATPEERRITQAEQKNLANALSQAANLSSEVKDALKETTQADSQRLNGGEFALVRNVTAAVVISAALASPAFIAFLTFGAAGTLIGSAAALPIFEALKRTKVFVRARDYISDRIDRITEDDAQRFLLRVREGKSAVQLIDRPLWRAASRNGYEWVSSWLDWMSNDKNGPNR